ncbi:inhibitor of apoptosis repeat-containing protein [Delitschia confertaspora ATCC 74209]|uniref:Inhibitor of apoptosis repeat-containing protein n=1 Tax=Delitschia confertaspora ATCC 74209 TaxID=1513339 RepID=A0A9P4JCJ1_9PLEO|nr:inhibitor of apoptosis repeat-containing protein [Delitschia confertaspora ATCC 74209]
MAKKPIMAPGSGMEMYQARLESFETQRLPKRRASNSKKKAAPPTAAWPHKLPSPVELAQAGFFFKPTATSPDNVMCFLCQRQLDGWEEDDNPTFEHATHSPDCGYAINQCIKLRLGDPNRAEDDPWAEHMMDARRATFADYWPHEGVEGMPQVEQLVEAGFCYDPSDEYRDGVTCPYCHTSLDEWDAGDDPKQEHMKRKPDCLFFALDTLYHPPQQAVKKKRASRASTASNASTTTKKTKRASTAKRGKVAKAAAQVEPSEIESDVEMLDEPYVEPYVEPEPPTLKKTKRASTAKKASTAKRGKTAKAITQIESSEIQPDVEMLDEPYGEPYVEPEPSPEPVPEPKPEANKAKPRAKAAAKPKAAPKRASARNSTASTRAAPVRQAMRGKKRTSDGVEKEQTETYIEPPTEQYREPNIEQYREPSIEQYCEPSIEQHQNSSSDKYQVPSSSQTNAQSSQHYEEEAASTPYKEPTMSFKSPIASTPFHTGTPYQESTPANSSNTPPVSPPIAASTPEGMPVTPPQKPARAPTWTPISITPILATKAEIFGLVSGVLVDSGLDKENLQGKNPGDLVKAVKEGLTAEEKQMTVGEWVMYNAKRGEEKLRVECERLVRKFLEEGERGVRRVEGLEVYD